MARTGLEREKSGMVLPMGSEHVPVPQKEESTAGKTCFGVHRVVLRQGPLLAQCLGDHRWWA